MNFKMLKNNLIIKNKFNKPLKSVFYVVPNRSIHILSKLFLNKEQFEFLYLPLTGIKKYFYYLSNLIYPITKLNHNQIYILLNLILRNKYNLLSYSYFSKRIQDLGARFKFIKTIQIQNGAQHIQIQRDVQLEKIDTFLSFSKYQSKYATNNFAKESYVVGSLSTENWIKKVEIAHKIEGFKYDICFIFNTKFKDDVKYALSLCMSYIIAKNKSSIFLCPKSTTNFDQIASFCRSKFDIDIFNHKQIFIIKKFTKFTTIETALKAKVVVGARSTVLYQAGSLGVIVYPIDISKPYGNLSGNLSNLDLNINPSKKLFCEKIKELSTKKGRRDYLDSNYKVLKELDETLRLDYYPSENIINFLREK